MERFGLEVIVQSGQLWPMPPRQTSIRSGCCERPRVAPARV
jgi:hypothetical protein